MKNLMVILVDRDGWIRISSVQNQLLNYIQEAKNVGNANNARDTIYLLTLCAKNWKSCPGHDIIRSSSGSLYESIWEHVI